MLPLNIIQYPNKLTEFEVQARVYMALREEGYDVRGEVRAWCEDRGDEHECRLDLVVFNNLQSAIAIIECKDIDKDSFDLTPGSRQGRRYSKFGVPVIRIGAVTRIPRLLEMLREAEARLEFEVTTT